MTQFYIFKHSAKQHLQSSSALFENLKDFLDSANEKSDPVVKITESQFIVSFEINAPKEEQEEQDVIAIEHAEASSQNDDDDHDQNDQENDDETYEEEYMMKIEVEEVEVDPIFEVETAQAESLSDQDYIVEDTFIRDESEDQAEERVFQCECGAITQSLAELQKHMSSHKRKSNVSCCGVGFRDFKSFHVHQRAHENFEAIVPHMPTFCCILCKVLFSEEDDLLTHNGQHISESFEGELIIEKAGAFDDHILRELKKSTDVVEPEEMTDDRQKLSCGHCTKKINEVDLKVHLLLFHTTTACCPIDNRCFSGSKQVRLFSEHIRNKHPELFNKASLYNCKYCNLHFTTNFEKLAHMKKCDSKLYACEGHCNKRFASEWLLRNHQRQVAGDARHSCDECGKRCVSRSDLQIHIRSHTNERPYSCPICHKCFKTSANRSSHMDIHEMEKKHECDVCFEKFQTRPILRKHKKKHDSTYQEQCICKICVRRYISKPHLLRHLKSSHGAAADLSTDGIIDFYEEHFRLNRPISLS